MTRNMLGATSHLARSGAGLRAAPEPAAPAHGRVFSALSALARVSRALAAPPAGAAPGPAPGPAFDAGFCDQSGGF